AGVVGGQPAQVGRAAGEAVAQLAGAGGRQAVEALALLGGGLLVVGQAVQAEGRRGGGGEGEPGGLGGPLFLLLREGAGGGAGRAAGGERGGSRSSPACSPRRSRRPERAWGMAGGTSAPVRGRDRRGAAACRPRPAWVSVVEQLPQAPAEGADADGGDDDGG